MLSLGCCLRKVGSTAGGKAMGLRKLEHPEAVVAREERSGVQRRGTGARKTIDLLRALLRTGISHVAVLFVSMWPSDQVGLCSPAAWRMGGGEME